MRVDQRLSGEQLFAPLKANGIEYFCGVPDSVIGPFSKFLSDHVGEGSHAITADEGGAIGLAIGYHIATGKTPLVYMQNSGFNNALDPLASLADRSVFRVPMLLLIGWRGEPGTSDEPQHSRQGQITTDLLRAVDIPFSTLAYDAAIASKQVAAMVKGATEQQKPHALLMKHDGFANSSVLSVQADDTLITREEALKAVIGSLDDTVVVISSLGKLSRELFEHRECSGKGHDKDLLVVGGMGHASAIALGIAQQRPEQKVICLDGDGSMLMHLGTLATIGNVGANNFYHILFNNSSHDSVGGHSTANTNTDFVKVAQACGYERAESVSSSDEIGDSVSRIQKNPGPSLLEIKIKPGSRPDLGRPSISPMDNKIRVMNFLNQ